MLIKLISIYFSSLVDYFDSFDHRNIKTRSRAAADKRDPPWPQKLCFCMLNAKKKKTTFDQCNCVVISLISKDEKIIDSVFHLNIKLGSERVFFRVFPKGIYFKISNLFFNNFQDLLEEKAYPGRLLTSYKSVDKETSSS